ncbi:MAG: hemolysin family protein [Phycisphaerae bacterium]|nr:hemolysin family protein [Phycisphaerae bacterium]
MIGWILLGLAFSLLATCYLSALNLALVAASRSALERRLVELGRLSGHGWVLDRMTEAAHAVALFRTTGRVMCFTLILVIFAGFGEHARLTGATLTATVITSVLLIWFFTSVLSSAIARYMPNGLIQISIPFLRVAFVLAAPLLALVDFVDEAVRRLAGAEASGAVEAEEDLLLTIEDSRKEGELDPLSARILENVVEFRSTSVSSVMTPRTNVIGLEYTDDLDRVRAFLAEAGHSRIPVFEDSLDQIVGVLYVKDLVRYLGTDAPGFRLRPLLREPIRVPEMKPVRELLLDFQHSEVHMAIVVDEYGGTSGLVTIEDVLEEIVGEINDEHDNDAEEAPELKPIGDGRWEISGRFRVGDLNAVLDASVPDEDDYDTVAGFLLKRFGRIPRAGESLDFEGWRFEVAAATSTQVLIVRIQAPEAEGSLPRGPQDASDSTRK